MRAALEALAAAAPGWLAGVIDASWQQVYGQRIDNLRLPESQAAREELAVQYGRDGYWLLEQVHEAIRWRRSATPPFTQSAALEKTLPFENRICQEPPLYCRNVFQQPANEARAC